MNVIYQYGFFVLIGIILGIFIALKWLASEGTEVRVGKFVIRGRQNVVTDVSDINVSGPEKRKTRMEIRKERREQRRTKRAAKKGENIT
ncbi:MAG: hypothetical protein AMS27_18115 [Bacteroides sp. SM23_62_1]|nr:MAG: hypothetical protein AMS27_18115 [Bacteroides sp. SM23_62_1]